MEKSLSNHSFSKSLLLHLLPGILAGALYFLLVPAVTSAGYPSFMALVLAGIFVLVPFEAGMLWYNRLHEKKKLFGELIPYVRAIPLWQYFLWVAVIVISAGLIFTLLNFTVEYLKELFRWIPPGLHLDTGLTGEFTKSKLIISYAFFFIFIVVLLPVAEELYFRGFLLPRMPENTGKWREPLHSTLFALYHVWTPWMFVARLFGVLPLIYIVRRKKNLFVGIIAHCILNSLDFITGLVFIFQL